MDYMYKNIHKSWVLDVNFTSIKKQKKTLKSTFKDPIIDLRIRWLWNKITFRPSNLVKFHFVYIYMYIWIYIYVYTYVYMCVCMCVCMYMCVYSFFI